ncbi:hypothetical protein F5Y09DRAFT_113745 [Xylaria sp. FL1042]|nr:hypothetical protein F5Y09DRAFT_113745 [Xylaria sp. FL1042]
MNATTPTTGQPSQARADQVRWRQSKIYQAIATPINFIVFLVSLYLIDNRNRAQRHRQPEGKANDHNRRTWLHRLLYRQRASPYDWVDSYQRSPVSQSAYTTPPHHEVRAKNGDAVSPRSTKETGGGTWYYHTKQKKLLKVEAADAFALRNSVFLFLGVLAVAVGWVLWRMVMWLTARILSRLVFAKV